MFKILTPFHHEMNSTLKYSLAIEIRHNRYYFIIFMKTLGLMWVCGSLRNTSLFNLSTVDESELRGSSLLADHWVPFPGKRWEHPRASSSSMMLLFLPLANPRLTLGWAGPQADRDSGPIWTISLEGVLWNRSHHGSYPSCSGGIWGGAVRRCLALLIGHHSNVHMVDLLYWAAANWKLWNGFVGGLCGPGAGSSAVPGLQRHPGPAAGH